MTAIEVAVRQAPPFSMIAVGLLELTSAPQSRLTSALPLIVSAPSAVGSSATMQPETSRRSTMAEASISISSKPNTRAKNSPTAFPLAAVRWATTRTALYGSVPWM